MKRNHRGDWEIFLPFLSNTSTLSWHQSKIKVRVIDAKGRDLDRIPAYTRRVVQDTETHDFTAQLFGFPEQEFRWTDEKLPPRW